MPSVSGIKGRSTAFIYQVPIKRQEGTWFWGTTRSPQNNGLTGFMLHFKKAIFLDSLSLKLDHIPVFKFVFHEPVLVTSYINWEGSVSSCWSPWCLVLPKENLLGSFTEGSCFQGTELKIWEQSCFTQMGRVREVLAVPLSFLFLVHTKSWKYPKIILL